MAGDAEAALGSLTWDRGAAGHHPARAAGVPVARAAAQVADGSEASCTSPLRWGGCWSWSGWPATRRSAVAPDRRGAAGLRGRRPGGLPGVPPVKERSGVELPDLPGPRLWFAWGPVMGEGGRCLHLGGGGAGAWGRRRQAAPPAPGAGARPSRRSPRRHLAAAGPELDGRSWLEVVAAAERRSAWARSRGEARRALVDPVLPRLAGRPLLPVPVSTGAAHGPCDRRWRWGARLGDRTGTPPADLGPGPGGSWREAAGATGTCGSAPSPSPASTVTGPGAATRSCGAAHAPWSGLDWEAKLSHLEDLHVRLAAVDQDAGQSRG